MVCGDYLLAISFDLWVVVFVLLLVWVACEFGVWCWLVSLVVVVVFPVVCGLCLLCFGCWLCRWFVVWCFGLIWFLFAFGWLVLSWVLCLLLLLGVLVISFDFVGFVMWWRILPYGWFVVIVWLGLFGFAICVVGLMFMDCV